MPWIVAGAMVVGAIASKSASDKASDAQGRAVDSQERAMRDQTALGREQLAWNKEQYGKWEDRFDPIFGDMMDSLYDDLTPNYAAIAGDVKSGFQSAKGQERRNLLRYGVRPQDGAMGRADREYGIREASAHVGARSQARESKRGLKYARLASVAGMGYGIQPSVQGNVTNSYGSLTNAHGQQANQYGNIASMWGNQALGISSGIGNFVGSMPWQGMWNSTKGWFGGGGGGGGNGSYGMYPKPTGQQGPPAPSDMRLKKNIKCVGEVGGHNIYTWEWNDIAIAKGITDPTFGVIAQEVPAEFTSEVDGYLAVDYSRLFGE